MRLFRIYNFSPGERDKEVGNAVVVGGGWPKSQLGSIDDARDDMEGVMDFPRVSLLGSTDGGSDGAGGVTDFRWVSRRVSLLGSTDGRSNEAEGITDFPQDSLLGSTDGGSNDTEGNSDGGGDKEDTPVLGRVGGLELFSTNTGDLPYLTLSSS